MRNNNDTIERTLTAEIKLRYDIIPASPSAPLLITLHGYGASKWHAVRGAIGICGGLPGDWETSDLYKETDAAVFHLAGERDEYYPPARVENYAAQLRARARDVEFRGYDAGHEISPAMRADIREWLSAK